MNPSVSVVIPAYNHAAFIGEAIQSVLDQSYADLEIVITDDGSSDGTPDVVGRFADPRINLEIFARNLGAAAALNSSIRRARGDFICMLASDDYFLPGKLEKQVGFLKTNTRIAAAFGMPQFVDERGRPSSANFNGDIFQAPFFKNLDSRQDWLRFFFFEGNCLFHPSAMIRRSAYAEVGLFDPRLASLPDLDMWVRLCMRHDIHVMPDELTAMRILDENRNMSAPRRDSNLRTLIEYFHILKHYRRFSLEVVRDVFAHEIASKHLDPRGPAGPLLAEIALLGQHPPHKLFALDTMFEETLTSDGNYPRLIELSGSIDVFAIETVRDQPRLSQELDAAHADAAQLRSALVEADAKVVEAHAEIAHLRDTLAYRDGELGKANAEAARLRDLVASAHAETGAPE
jgi:glycosyltransferase involved in cell wall biosynthesis